MAAPTVAEQAAAALAHLRQTTVNYPTYVRNVSKNIYPAGGEHTHWGQALAILEGLAVEPSTPTVTTPRFSFRAVYDIGNKSASPQYPWCTTDFTDPKADLGITHVALPIADARVAAKLSAAGLLSAGWYVGMWNNITKAWTTTDTQVTNWVKAVKDAGAGNRYYLADEPLYSPEFVAALGVRMALIRSLDPAAIFVICDYVWSGRNQLGHWALETEIDECWLSGSYGVVRSSAGSPGRYVQENLDAQMVAAAAAKLLRPDLVFRGIIGMHNDIYAPASPDPAYTGNNAVIPSFPGSKLAGASSENQIQQQVDAYRASPTMEGIIAFSYAPYPETGPPATWTGWLRNRPDLCSEMASQFMRA